MTCTKCDQHITTCTCPDRNERLAKAQASPHVFIEMGGIIRPGDVVLYHEDGGLLRCEVVTNTSSEGKDEYRFKVLEEIRPCQIGGNAEVGEEFDVMQRTDCGAWGGMWSIRLESKGGA